MYRELFFSSFTQTQEEAPDHALNVRIKSKKYLRDHETGGAAKAEADHGEIAVFLFANCAC
jgi:hypothetical protein